MRDERLAVLAWLSGANSCCKCFLTDVGAQNLTVVPVQAEDFYAQSKGKAGEYYQGAKDAAGGYVDAAGNYVAAGQQKAGEAYGAAKGKAGEYADDAKVRATVHPGLLIACPSQPWYVQHWAGIATPCSVENPFHCRSGHRKAYFKASIPSSYTAGVQS